MMQKSTYYIFTTIFRTKKCYFHYDFACKKVPLSLRYAKKKIFYNIHLCGTLKISNFTYLPCIRKVFISERHSDILFIGNQVYRLPVI
jgi:hypothetical protein